MVKILTLKDREKIDKIRERRAENTNQVVELVKPIISDVKKEGDKALEKYTEKFDGIKVKNFKVGKEEIKEAYANVSDNVIKAIKESAENIRKYHKLQMPKEWMKKISKGVEAGQLVRPLDSVGCYVPGGNYPLVSTVIMTVVPARVAGVEEVVICSPPEINAAVIAAADICGATAIYKIGGAQAIAAMAYGTESVPKVNKIIGPGNIYVAAAKKIVYGECGIDFIAGPSEVMIVANENSSPQYIAADMLSQAEHDKLASSVLVTTSKEIAEKVNIEIEKQLNKLSTRDIAKASLDNYGAIVIVDNIDEAFDFVNYFGPEHLEIMINKKSLLEKVKNAGAVFLGDYSVEAAGDYISGPNHVLPTNGFAKIRAGLSILDYIKMPTVQSLTKEGLNKLKESILILAEAEGLEAHKRSVEIRK
ncbi:MAG: histidinol dehydrogenase [Nanoarchaeota archaeon]|nr:histidinol dehydrogenase [Nanoarchaeota archaeon]